MQFTLDNFEQQANTTIFNRALKYYKQGKVIDLLETNEGWEGVVAGTDEYTIEIINDSEDLKMTCSCPYDIGPICKHQIAVLLAIKNGLVEQPTRKKTRKKRPTKTEKLTAQAQKIINDLELAEVKNALAYFLKNDNSALERFIANFSKTELDSAFYKRQLRADISFAKGRDGFIDYLSTDKATRTSGELLNNAFSWQKQGLYSKVIPIAQALIEVMVVALQSADDSSGEIGGCVKYGLELLANSAPRLNKTEQSRLFKYLMKEGQKEIYSGWHWQWEFYKISVDLINDDATEKQLLCHLDEIENLKKIEDSWSSFGMPYMIDIKSKLIKRRHPEQYLDFLKKHKYIEAIRKELIAFYIKNEKWDEAEQECDLTLSAGLHIRHADFLKLLLKVVRAKNNTDRELDCVVKLWRTTGNMEYYCLAKKLVDEKKWPTYLEKIIAKELKRRKSGFQSLFFSEPTVAEIYKREGWWDKLISLIETKPNFYLFESYRRELESRYKERVFSLYKREVYENLARVASRKNYQRQCKYLRRIKKLGFFEELEKIIIDLKQKYPQRRALIEELSTI